MKYYFLAFKPYLNTTRLVTGEIGFYIAKTSLKSFEENGSRYVEKINRDFKKSNF